jgi:hypothetical protein
MSEAPGLRATCAVDPRGLNPVHCPENAGASGLAKGYRCFTGRVLELGAVSSFGSARASVGRSPLASSG